MKNSRLLQTVPFFLAVLAGVLHSLSFQPRGLWIAGWFAIGIMLFVLGPSSGRVPIQRPWLKWLGVGFIYAVSTALCSLPWIASFVGLMPWIALSIVLGVLGIPAALAAGYLLCSRLPSGIRIVGASLCFVAGETLIAHWPFGGFPWLRLAWGQVNGPFADAVALGSTALVSALVTLAGAVCYAVGTKQWRTVAIVLCVIVSVSWAGQWVVEKQSATDQRSVRIATIQGNVPRLGLEFNAQRRAVLENHAQATRQLADAVKSGDEPQPDVVIWPENASDVSPFTDATAARIIDSAAQEIKAPIVLGTFTYDHGTQNTMVVWDNETGPGERHEKIYLQPFGETMPFRDLLRKVTDKVDLAGNMTPGDGDGVVHTSRKLAIGLATCYEVVFDGAYRNAVHNGAEILATPTNNATFGFTDMTYQQLAMSRMRAKEFHRATVVAATSGVSAIISDTGQVESQSRIFEQKVLTATLPLHSDFTPAARYGEWVEVVLTALAILAVLAAVAADASATRKPKKVRQK